MILFLDTCDLNKIKFALIYDDKKRAVKTKVISIIYEESHKTLEYLEKFLAQAKVKITDLKKIIICSGPGSFTGVRVGASIAQGIGFAQNIPVKTIKKERIPKNLKNLANTRLDTKLKLDYGRPAVY